MPYNGSGVYSLPAGSLVADGTTIDAADHNTPLQDIEAALSTVVLRNGAAPMTGNQVISVNGDGNALRITQTGAGNALLVEDSSNPDSSPLVVDGNGNLGLGVLNPLSRLDVLDQAPIFGASRADSTNKVWRPRIPTWALGTTYFTPIFASAEETRNIVNIGGGTTLADAATDFRVFTTPSVGTPNGTERLRIINNGAWGLGGANYGSAGDVLTSQGPSLPPVWAAGSPAGAMIAYAGIVAPSGWLFCFGQNISRTSFANLFAAVSLTLTVTATTGSPTLSAASVDVTPHGLVGSAVEGAGIPAGATVLNATSTSITISANATASGTGVSIRLLPWGNGDGSTTFTLPDKRGRGSFGRDDMGGTAANRVTTAGSGINGARLGAAGGAETHTLTTAQMPLHGHPYRASYVSQSTASSSTTGGFMHSTGSVSTQAAFTGTPSNTQGQQIGGEGGGDAHNNMPPGTVENWIIKT